jgi:hypothetical protein
LSEDGHDLFTVNAGSNSISRYTHSLGTFHIAHDGSLALVGAVGACRFGRPRGRLTK